MISCNILISVLLLLLSEKTQSVSVDIIVDTNKDYPKVTGLALTNSQYFPSTDVPPLTTLFGNLLDLLLETPSAGFWINSNDPENVAGSLMLERPIEFSWTHSAQNFARISLKYYYQQAEDNAEDNAAKLTFLGLTNAVIPLDPTPLNVWTATKFYTIPAGTTGIKLEITRTNDITQLDYFILDSVTFQSDTAGADCRPENQNTFTPTVIIHGAYFYCYFNSNYNRWFVSWFMCPVVQDVQHEFCKSAQVCRVPSAECVV